MYQGDCQGRIYDVWFLGLEPPLKSRKKLIFLNNVIRPRLHESFTSGKPQYSKPYLKTIEVSFTSVLKTDVKFTSVVSNNELVKSFHFTRSECKGGLICSETIEIIRVESNID